MSEAEIQKLLELPMDERSAITRRLLESLAPSEVPEWHLEIVREELATSEADADAGTPWEEVKGSMHDWRRTSAGRLESDPFPTACTTGISRTESSS